MTPSEKERIIKEGFDAIRKVYNLREDLLADADKLEAAKESNRKLSDRVANLEVTIETLNSAIDKKDVEINIVKNSNDTIFDNYLGLCHKYDANEDIKRQMIADNRKKKDEIKRLKEELDLLQKAHTKLCCDYSDLNRTAKVNAGVVHKYNALCEKTAILEDNFHELRERFARLYLLYIDSMLEPKDVTAFTDWFNATFGDFGVYDEEE
jgi:predicted nuclease with TOPRIM domain